MGEKKPISLTGKEESIRKAMVDCMAPKEWRMRRLSNVIMEQLKKDGKTASRASVMNFIGYMVKEKVLVEVARDKAPGEKQISVLYELNQLAYIARDFIVSTEKRKASPYPAKIAKKMKATPAAPPIENKKDEKPRLDLEKIYKAICKIFTERALYRTKLMDELAVIDADLAKLDESIKAFEQGEKIGRELLKESGE